MPIHDWKNADAGVFHHFHQSWITHLTDAFNAGALPRGYFALTDQVAGGVRPDVLTLQLGGVSSPADDEGGVAVSVAPPQTRIISQAARTSYADSASRVTIRNPLGEVVAILEIVSPGNKDSVHAVRSFVEKGLAFLKQGVNFLFVDLFPPSVRDPQGLHGRLWEELDNESFFLPPDKPLTLASYSAGDVITAYVEPVSTGDTLRDMPLFLSPLKYIPAPLERSYQETWDRCPEPLKQAVAGSRNGG